MPAIKVLFEAEVLSVLKLEIYSQQEAQSMGPTKRCFLLLHSNSAFQSSFGLSSLRLHQLQRLQLEQLQQPKMR
jgi:hypothetical protein